jgi:hypothetical protein
MGAKSMALLLRAWLLADPIPPSSLLGSCDKSRETRGHKVGLQRKASLTRASRLLWVLLLSRRARCLSGYRPRGVSLSCAERTIAEQRAVGERRWTRESHRAEIPALAEIPRSRHCRSALTTSRAASPHDGRPPAPSVSTPHQRRKVPAQGAAALDREAHSTNVSFSLKM